MAHLNGSFNGCWWTILSLVQFLFSFENNRIAKLSLPKKAVLVTQSFMCLHDYTKHITVKFGQNTHGRITLEQKINLARIPHPSKATFRFPLVCRGGGIC